MPSSTTSQTPITSHGPQKPIITQQYASTVAPVNNNGVLGISSPSTSSSLGSLVTTAATKDVGELYSILFLHIRFIYSIKIFSFD